LDIFSANSKINALSLRFEATRRIRDMESNGHIPILAMTADVIQATYEECQRCGMDGYVSKPFEAEQLYQEVSRFLQPTSNVNL
jgi:histidine kinase 2/3/4 (cytokinin receptor)